MDGIANVARQQQQAQMSATEQNERVAHAQKADVVKQMQEDNSDPKINSKEAVEELVDKLNKAIEPMNTNIKFGVDSQDIFYVSVIEAKTNKMLRRYPAEQAAEFLPKMQEVTGILFDSKG